MLYSIFHYDEQKKDFYCCHLYNCSRQKKQQYSICILCVGHQVGGEKIYHLPLKLCILLDQECFEDLSIFFI
jgi:hypothetical protein